MLSFDKICEYFPKRLIQANSKGIFVEYLQYEFLDSLFKLPGSEKLSFIGGTAIRIIYESQRFSEDLDFDNFGLSASAFSSLADKACAEMRLKGFSLERSHVTRGPHYHCYIKFPGLLQSLGLTGHREEKIHLSLDSEKKKKIVTPQIKLLNKFGIYRNIPVNPADILLAQKLLAILYRCREKGRDFYDASFLWGLTEPNYTYLKKQASLSKDDFSKKLMGRCAKLNYKNLAKDVEAFLFDEPQKERVLRFIDLLKDKLPS